MSDKSELHELIDSMTPIQAKAALQQIASYCEDCDDKSPTVADVVRDDMIWIIEETAVNFDGLVKTFENSNSMSG